MYNYRMTMEYDGTNYLGFQKKESNRTVSYKLEQAIWRVTGEEAILCPAVKTEPGVHAWMQTVHVKLQTKIDVEEFQYLLNRILPQDIAIKTITLEEERFHASLSLESCTYQCILDIAPVPDVFQIKYSVHVGPNLDILSMKQAASHFIGIHDFSAFSVGKTKKSTEKTISEISLSTNEEGTKLFLTITSDRFLRNMPQRIVGTLLDIGMGNREPDDVKQIFEGLAPCSQPCQSKAFHLTKTMYF